MSTGATAASTMEHQLSKSYFLKELVHRRQAVGVTCKTSTAKIGISNWNVLLTDHLQGWLRHHRTSMEAGALGCWIAAVGTSLGQ